MRIAEKHRTSLLIDFISLYTHEICNIRKILRYLQAIY